MSLRPNLGGLIYTYHLVLANWVQIQSNCPQEARSGFSIGRLEFEGTSYTFTFLPISFLKIDILLSPIFLSLRENSDLSPLHYPEYSSPQEYRHSLRLSPCLLRAEIQMKNHLLWLRWISWFSH